MNDSGKRVERNRAEQQQEADHAEQLEPRAAARANHIGILDQAIALTASLRTIDRIQDSRCWSVALCALRNGLLLGEDLVAGHGCVARVARNAFDLAQVVRVVGKERVKGRRVGLVEAGPLCALGPVAAEADGIAFLDPEQRLCGVVDGSETVWVVAGMAVEAPELGVTVDAALQLRLAFGNAKAREIRILPVTEHALIDRLLTGAAVGDLVETPLMAGSAGERAVGGGSIRLVADRQEDRLACHLVVDAPVQDSVALLAGTTLLVDELHLGERGPRDQGPGDDELDEQPDVHLPAGIKCTFLPQPLSHWGISPRFLRSRGNSTLHLLTLGNTRQDPKRTRKLGNSDAGPIAHSLVEDAWHDGCTLIITKQEAVLFSVTRWPVRAIRRFVFMCVWCSVLIPAFGGSAKEPGDAGEPAVHDAMRWVESTPRAIELGKSTFGTCMGCHGTDGVGRIGIGPRIASETYLQAASDDFLVRTIKEGRTGTTMIPWGAAFNDETIHALVAYLRSLSPVEPATLDESALAGDPAKGAVVFRNICSGCHGRSGAGYQETANGTGIGRKVFLDTASNGFIRFIVGQGKSQTKMRGFAADNITAVANLTPEEIDDTIAYLRANAW